MGIRGGNSGHKNSECFSARPKEPALDDRRRPSKSPGGIGRQVAILIYRAFPRLPACPPPRRHIHEPAPREIISKSPSSSRQKHHFPSANLSSPSGIRISPARLRYSAPVCQPPSTADKPFGSSPDWPNGGAGS